MADIKEYAYYRRGDQFAIMEVDTTTLPNTTFQGDTLWKSPQASITDGIEIEYSYSGKYRINSTGTEGTDFHRFIGWGSNGTELLLFTYKVDAVYDISGLFAADDYIVISGSSKWNGLHQVKSTGGSTGILTLKTKCNLKPSTISVTGSFANIGGLFNGDNAAADMDIEAFKDLISTYDKRETPYIFVDVAVDAKNNGIFSVTYDSTSGQITFGNKITIDADGDYTSTTEDIQDEDGDAITIYNIFYEQITVYGEIDVLNDEADELPVSEHLSKAIVYYVKAKLAEDAGQFELKEYNMKEFYRLAHKSKKSREYGPTIVMPGSHAIR